MVDLATLGLSIDSRPAVEAGAALDRFAASGARAETAARGVEAASTRMGRAANENAAALANAQRGLSGVTGILEQSIAAHVRAEAAMGRWRRATNDVADTTKLAAFQVQNLRAQFLDIGTSLYGGMNPLMVLAQQGPQILGIFGPGTGLTGVLRGVAGELARLVPLGAGVAGGLVAGGLAVAGGYTAWDSAQKAVAVGLTGLGRQSGLAAGQIDQIARSSQIATGTAREYATAFAATGNATADTIATALSKTRDFATTLNVSQEEAAKVQTEFFADASGSYDKYAARLGVFSASSSRLIRDLQQQGRGGEAVRLAFEQINPALARYSELASTGTKVTTAFSDAWGNLWSNVSRGAAVLVNDSRLTTTPQQIAAAAAAGEAARQRAVQERATAVAIDIDRANQVANNNPVRRQTLENIDRAGLRNLPPTGSELRDRFDDVFARGAQASTGSFGQFPTTYGDAEKRMREALAVQPRTPDDLRGQIETLTQRSNDIAQSRALDDVQRQATRTQEAQAAAMGKTAGEAERLTTRAGLLNRATADGIPLSSENARRIDEVSAAYGRQAQAIAEAGLRREIAFQREQLGRTPGEAAIAAQLRGVYGDDLSSSGARAAAEQLRLNDEIRTTQAAYSSLAQMGSGLIDPLLDQTRSWSDAFSDLARNIARAALQAAIFGQGPLAGLFGTQGAGGGPGGLVGSLIGSVGGNPLSSLFGGGGVSDIGTTDGPGIWFANGGIMTSRGQVPLHRYATGGIATSPQVAIFGEGRGPEAYVPLPDGRRIPVAMQQLANSNTAGGFTDARVISIDARGSTMSEGQFRSVLDQALAENNAVRDRTLASRMTVAQRRFG